MFKFDECCKLTEPKDQWTPQPHKKKHEVNYIKKHYN